jgi:hypothetical protein
VDATICQLGRKCGHIAVEIPCKIILGGRHAEFPKNLPDDPTVGAAGEIDVIDPAVDAENGAECHLERAHPRAARSNQRSINVPQKQCIHRGNKRAFLGIIRCM